MFGQVVVGPPGCGKTTYCNGMVQFLDAIERGSYVDLVTLEAVMETYSLGPNGGLLYCIEFLEKNIDWLLTQLNGLPKGSYVIFDCPGQVELYSHHSSMKSIIQTLSKEGWRLTCVHLVDSYYCNSASTYLAAVSLSLSVMLQLELPHVNVLSKIDLLSQFGKLDFNLEAYMDADNLSELQYVLGKGATAKYQKLTAVLCEIIEDFALVSFTTLNIQDKQSIINLLYLIDKANGYSYSGTPSAAAITSSVDVRSIDFDYYRVGQIQERYVADDEEEEQNSAAKNDDL